MIRATPPFDFERFNGREVDIEGRKDGLVAARCGYDDINV
jgi:hypothetical protein